MSSGNGHHAHHAAINGRRLTQIPTDELDYLAEQFHQLTVRMYEELCIRRTAEHGTAHIEAMLHECDEDPS